MDDEIRNDHRSRSDSVEDRIKLAKRRIFVPTPRTTELLGRFEDLFDPSSSTYVQCYLLAGESGTGKTTLLHRFRSAHPSNESADGERDIVPIAYIMVPESPTLGSLYHEVLRSLGYPPFWASTERRRDTALDMLKELKTKIIVVDEVQHFLHTGTKTKDALLDALKMFANKGFPVVAAGTREAIAAFHQHSQIDRRFDQLDLPRFKMDREFRMLLKTIEAFLPLQEPSGLDQRALAEELHAMSAGLLGQLWRTLERATIIALSSGAEAITPEILSRVARPPKR